MMLERVNINTQSEFEFLCALRASVVNRIPRPEI